jgi:hypothetical protein
MARWSFGALSAPKSEEQFELDECANQYYDRVEFGKDGSA